MAAAGKKGGRGEEGEGGREELKEGMKVRNQRKEFKERN
jgi:hypothetical protein